MKEKLLLLGARSEISNYDLGILDTKLYYPPYMTIEEANLVSWRIFKEKSKSLFIFRPSPESAVEYCITAKSMTWSRKDINIFAGSEKRVIRTLDDMSEDEARSFLYLNFVLGQGLVNRDDREVHVTIGFNPSDSSPGIHSIKDKLHSNLYVADNAQYRKDRQKVEWQKLSWFERLAFIEPFSGIYHDYLSWRIRNGLFHEQLSRPGVEKNPGYTSIYFRDIATLLASISQIYHLYCDVSREYELAESVFTDRQEESETGYQRFIPLGPMEIFLRLGEYVQTKKDWISQDSIKLLHYLARRLQPATPRTSSVQNINSAQNLWIAKGFSGAINFTFNHDNSYVRFDFLPKVITTSGTTKVISTKDHPTLIRKSMGHATDEEQSEMQDFQRLTVKLAAEMVNSENLTPVLY